MSKKLYKLYMKKHLKAFKGFDFALFVHVGTGVLILVLLVNWIVKLLGA